MTETAPVRVMHVLANLSRGGVETWLMNVYRNIDRERIQFDFLQTGHDEGVFTEEAKSLGARFFHIEPVRKPIAFVRSIRSVLREQQVSVLHSHLFRFSGLILRLAAMEKTALCIAHGHTGMPDANTLRRALYKRLTHRWLWKYAHVGLGCSSFALEHLFGPEWVNDNRFRVLPYGIDFTRFAEQLPLKEAKQSLNISPSSKVIGHVGRMIPIKNHTLLIKAFSVLRQQGHDVHLLLVGGGELTESLEEEARQLGVLEHCTFAGDQKDVAPFLAAMDVKCFPSLREGLGIVALEAMATGTPVVMSNTIPTEIEVIPSMVKRVSLDDSPDVWAEALLEQANAPRREASETNRIITNSHYGIESCVKSLMEIYQVN